MRIIQIVSGATFVIAVVACAHAPKEPAEYGNQATRMGAPTDSSRRDQTSAVASAPASGTAGQSDPNLIGSPAWWRTHVTADGKLRP
jgi:hypothetical protein